MTQELSDWGWVMLQLDRIVLDPARSEQDRQRAAWLWHDMARGSGLAAAVSVGSGFVARQPHHSGHNLWLHDMINDWDGA